MGKYVPPKKPKNRFINQVMGSPLLKTIIKAAEIIPMLLKEIAVRIKITNTAQKLVLANLTPKKQTPRNRQIRACNELKIKSQQDIEIIIVEALVGVKNIASKVPIICSSLMLTENVFKATAK